MPLSENLRDEELRVYSVLPPNYDPETNRPVLAEFDPRYTQECLDAGWPSVFTYATEQDGFREKLQWKHQEDPVFVGLMAISEIALRKLPLDPDPNYLARQRGLLSKKIREVLAYELPN